MDKLLSPPQTYIVKIGNPLTHTYEWECRIQLPSAIADDFFAGAARKLRMPLDVKSETLYWGFDYRGRQGLSTEETTLIVWSERDRCSIELRDEQGETLLMVWDECVQEAINDGFLHTASNNAQTHRDMLAWYHDFFFPFTDNHIKPPKAESEDDA